MEQENPGNLPDVPDDVSDLTEDIHYRAEQRRRAIEVNLENAKNSATERDRDYWLAQAMEFADILDEYRSLYPELFQD